MSTLVLAGLAGLSACNSSPTEEFDVLVWADELTAEDELSGGTLFDGPCGPRLLRSVASLTELTPQEFNGLEKAIEYSASGEIINSWRAPVGASIAGIFENWLIVRSRGHYIAISTAGELRSPEILQEEAEPEYAGRCSGEVRDSFLGESGASAYLGCWELSDRSTGELRYIAYEGPCT